MLTLAANTDTEPARSGDADLPLLGLEVRLADGSAHKIDAAAGFNAMELIRAGGVPIKAECGGAGICATCHCRVPDAWTDRLPAANDEEQNKLDEIPSADDRSRLACQIRFTDDLDGLVLELQPDSLHPRYLDAAE
jgi:ferredoxin, 2Fe-2S